MTTGVGASEVIFFTATPPEFIEAETLRPTPTGYIGLSPFQSDNVNELKRNAYPQPYWPTLKGYYVYGFFDDYYNRIHIFPNIIDFQYIASEVSQTFQVWNAYLTPQTLDGVVPVNNSGIVLTGGPPSGPLNAHTFLGLEVQTYTVTTNQQGPGAVDCTYTFVFPSVMDMLLSVIGSRVTAFPFQPNWVTPPLETLEWLTEVKEMRDGSEQRSRMRQNPRQSLEYEFLVHHDDAHLLRNAMFGWQGRMWAVPLWQQGQRLSDYLNNGTTFIPCDTNGYGYVADGQIILFSSATVYEILQIDSVSSTGITTKTPTVFFWVGGTFVFPVRMAHITGSPTVRKITGEIGAGTVQFISELTIEPTSTWAATYNGYPVLEVEPNRVTAVEETWDRRVSILDYHVGNSTQIDKHNFSTITRTGKYLSVNRQRYAELRDILSYAQGRWKPFWGPTFDNDFILVQDVPDGSVGMIIKHCLYTQRAALKDQSSHIRIRLISGATLYREIVASDDINTPVGTETISITPAISTGFKPSDVYMISYMPLVRLNTDKIETGWITMNVANTSLPLRPIRIPS